MKFTFTSVFLFLLVSFSPGQIDQNRMFESSKGKWRFPLKQYTQIQNGENIQKNGKNVFDSTLTIKTNNAAEVYAVYQGRVIGSFEYNGEYTLVTRLGNYTIAYTRLAEPTLKKNDQVKAGQKIGRLINLTRDHYSLELNLYFMERKEPAAESVEIKFSPYKWIDWKTAPDRAFVK